MLLPSCSLKQWILPVLSHRPMQNFLYVLLLSLLISSCVDDAEKQEQQPPNIVIFLADDQGWGDLSSNGNTNLSTPHIDRIAEAGAHFSHFYVSPVCSPTRAELLTGRHHARGGVFATSAGGERLDLDETTIAEVFKEAGYATAAFGKWHNGMQPPYHPNARGFDEFYGFASGHWGHYFSPMLEHNGEIVQGEGFVVDDFTSKAIDFIESHQDQPFFVYLPYNTPHSPMQVPDTWWEKFENHDVSMRNREPDREDLLHTRAALAMVENIDWNVGRVLTALSDLSLDENTIVLYLTDNGPNGHRWNGDMRGRKGSTDEGGVRSPLYIQWPGVIEPGLMIDRIASVIDLLPTLAEMAGISYDTRHPIDGTSLRPLLLSQDTPWPDRIVFSHWRGNTSLRTQQFRLDQENRLYDMESDPGQRTDVSQEHQELTSELITTKTEWEETVLAELTREQLPFTVGHPDFALTHLPARDAIASGDIERSNRYPNDSYFKNWTREDETITWDIEVLESGTFEAVVYYAVSAANTGATVQLEFGASSLSTQITEANDPPLLGMEHDRVERQESYVKNFKPMSLGMIQLEKGGDTLSLRATDIPGDEVMEFRLLVLERVE